MKTYVINNLNSFVFRIAGMTETIIKNRKENNFMDIFKFLNDIIYSGLNLIFICSNHAPDIIKKIYFICKYVKIIR